MSMCVAEGLSGTHLRAQGTKGASKGGLRRDSLDVLHQAQTSVISSRSTLCGARGIPCANTCVCMREFDEMKHHRWQCLTSMFHLRFARADILYTLDAVAVLYSELAAWSEALGLGDALRGHCMGTACCAHAMKASQGVREETTLHSCRRRKVLNIPGGWGQAQHAVA
jgi:hypothetical protein